MFQAPNNGCVFWSPGQQQRSGVTRPDVACQRKSSQLKRVKKPSQFRILGVLISLRLNFTRGDVTKRVTPDGENVSRLLHGPDDGTNRCTCRVNLPFLEKRQSFFARRLFGEKARQEVNYVGESGGCFNQSSASSGGLLRLQIQNK